MRRLPGVALGAALAASCLVGIAPSASAAPRPTPAPAPQAACSTNTCDPDPVSCMSWSGHIETRRSAFYIMGGAHGRCAKNKKLKDYWMHYYQQGCYPKPRVKDKCGIVPGSYKITGASTAPHDVAIHVRVECRVGTVMYFRGKSAIVSRNHSGMRKSWPWQTGPTSGNKRCAAPVNANAFAPTSSNPPSPILIGEFDLAA